MITLLTILLAIVLASALFCMVSAMMNGCPFAWLWYLTGGMDSLISLIVTLFQAVADGLGSIDTDN